MWMREKSVKALENDYNNNKNVIQIEVIQFLRILLG